MSAHASHPHALIAVANGSEDIETVTTLDVLRRAGILVSIRCVIPGSVVFFFVNLAQSIFLDKLLAF